MKVRHGQCNTQRSIHHVATKNRAVAPIRQNVAQYEENTEP